MEKEIFKNGSIKNNPDLNAKTMIIPYDDLPRYDLFLSQVIDYLNDKLGEEEYTSNIIQNYIKNEVISRSEDGKKRGYTKVHLIQLILLSYMRAILTTDEIKKVFKLAFNDINNHKDDIISWELAYKTFTNFQTESLNDDSSSEHIDVNDLNKFLNENNVSDVNRDRIKTFLTVMILIAKASAVKRHVQGIVDNYVIIPNK